MPDEPIDWPALYATGDAELYEAGDRYRDAIGAQGLAAIAWADAPSKATRDATFRAALRLRDAKAKLDAIGARLWAERKDRRR